MVSDTAVKNNLYTSTEYIHKYIHTVLNPAGNITELLENHSRK